MTEDAKLPICPRGCPSRVPGMFALNETDRYGLFAHEDVGVPGMCVCQRGRGQTPRWLSTFLSTSTLVSLCLFLFTCCNHPDTNDIDDTLADSSISDTTEVVTRPTNTITFILGDDKTAFNQYYDMAGHYYRLSSEENTDVVVDHLTSLKQVLDYLSKHPPADSLPYGLINLVSHGNEFIDLQMTVTPRGKRASGESIRKALARKQLTPPDSTIVDSNTIIFLHGCAVGNNLPLLDALSEAFGGRGRVVASRLFEYYAYLSRNKNPQSIRHYYARTWYAFYHPDSAFDEEEMVRQLSESYPDDSIDWREGLRRRFQDNPSQIYHYSFTVPCSYEETYSSAAEMPSVATRQKRQQWVDSHHDFQKLLASTHVPRSYFQIKFYRLTNLLDDNTIIYGLKVKARAGVICLIKPLTVADTLSPYSPYRTSYKDTTIFAFSASRSNISAQ